MFIFTGSYGEYGNALNLMYTLTQFNDSFKVYSYEMWNKRFKQINKKVEYYNSKITFEQNVIRDRYYFGDVNALKH